MFNKPTRNLLIYALKHLVLFLSLGTTSVHAATITINTSDLIVNSPTDGFCNLKEAIDAANTNLASGALAGECAAGELHPVVDVIEFDVTTLPAYFSTFEPYTIIDSLHIKGPASELVTFSAIAFNRVFEFSNLMSDAQFIISDVTFADIAIRLPFNIYGGAVLAQHVAGAALTFERVQFLRNNAEQGGGAIGLVGGSDNTTVIKDCYFLDNYVENALSGAGGGAIFIGGSQHVTIENSTFESNAVRSFGSMNPLDDAAGGAILVRATATGGPSFTSTLNIKQSTFSDNSAYGVGGAVAQGGPGYPSEFSEVDIRHSTFIANQADLNQDQIGSDSGGGGIYTSSTEATTLFNNIIASNIDFSQTSSPEVAGDGGGVISLGYNLIGNNLNASIEFPTGLPNINDDFVGEAPLIILPFVAPLEFNGGPTPTYRLIPGSLAIDQGKCSALTSDQRHHHNDITGQRTVDRLDVSNFASGCDIGAYELGAVSEIPVPEALELAYVLNEGDRLIIDENSGGLIGNDTVVVISAGNFDSSASSTQGLVELLADGSFEFQTYDPDAYGLTTFNYTISDLYNQDDGEVTLRVLPVNDAPFYNATQNQITANAGQAITIPVWATDISPGAVNEVDQNLIFQVADMASPPGFFATLPSVDASSGDLSFELALAASGTAEMSITLRDDGGTDSGGEDSFNTILFIHVSDLIFANSFE